MRMMHDRLIEKQYWYNLQEITSIAPYELYFTRNIEDFIHDIDADANVDIYDKWFPSGETKTTQLALLGMIWQRFFDHYVVPVEEEIHDADGWTALQYIVISKLTNIYLQTKERYAKLIQLYEAEKSNLMNGISTTTSGVARFNDTPQNLTDGDEFGDNTHVSNISKNSGTTTTDADTKIARLDEIRRKLPDLYKEWTDEFEQMFIEKENIV